MIALHWCVKRMMCACFFVKIAVFSSAQLKSLFLFYINLLKLLTARILFASHTFAMQFFFSLFSWFIFSFFLYRITNKYKHKNRNYALHTNTLEHINLFEKKNHKNTYKIQNQKINLNLCLSISLTLNHWIQRIHAFKTHAHDMNIQKTHAIIGMEYVMVHAWSHVLFKKHQKVKVVHVVGKYRLIQNYFD